MQEMWNAYMSTLGGGRGDVMWERVMTRYREMFKESIWSRRAARQ